MANEVDNSWTCDDPKWGVVDRELEQLRGDMRRHFDALYKELDAAPASLHDRFVDVANRQLSEINTLVVELSAEQTRRTAREMLMSLDESKALL